MKRILFVSAALALALPTHAQDAPDFNEGQIDLAIGQRDSDTLSSKFLEYRDIPQGGQVPFLRLRGKKGDLWYDVMAFEPTQTDQRYSLELAKPDFKVSGFYTGIPHNFGNGGKSLLRPTTESFYRLSDDTQQFYQDQLRAGFPASTSYARILALVTPGLDAAPSDVDLKLTRDRSMLAIAYAPKEARYTFGVTYLHERRSGTRAANGTSFGFNNVVETPEPLRYITQDFGVDGSYSGDWGVARAAFHFNDFKNAFDTFGWDNPFRAVDSTGGTAYLAPSGASLDGPAFGLYALPPDNKAVTGSVGATFKWGPQTRLSADVGFGQWTQNETPFIPFTTNTAVLLPDGRPAANAALPASELDGKIDTMSLSAYFTTQLVDNLRLNARYSRYDHDNKTPAIRFEEGYVRFDSVWEEIPRISVPYGYTNDRFEALLAYDFGKATLEGGYKYTKMDRTFRETRKTTENGVRLALDVRSSEWILLRGLYEFARRDFDEYDAIRGEEESFLDPEAPANQPTLRRYDQAKRDLQRFGGTVQLTPPSGKATVSLSYTKTMQDYDDAPVPFVLQAGSEAPLGLLKADYETFTLEGDFAPTDRASFYAFYSRENIDDFQTGRQSGATLSFNPADGWTSTVADKVDSIGGGASFVLKPDKWNLDVFGRWQKADGSNTFTAGSNRGVPQSIPLFDDTELTHVSAQLKYQIDASWSVAGGAFFEDYDVKDAQSDGILFYMPGSFFLAADNADYSAWVGYLNLRYNW